MYYRITFLFPVLLRIPMQIQLPVVDYRLLRVIRYFYHQNHCTLLLFYKYICYVGVLQIVDYDFNVILFSKFTECLDLHP